MFLNWFSKVIINNLISNVFVNLATIITKVILQRGDHANCDRHKSLVRYCLHCFYCYTPPKKCLKNRR